MTKRLFIDIDFAEVERRTFATAAIFQRMPDYVFVCTDGEHSQNLIQAFKNATAIETEGHEQTD